MRHGNFYYYSRTQAGKQYPIYCRKVASGDGTYNKKAPEFVMLDQNELANGLNFLSIESLEVSDDANLLAYTTDKTGFRQYGLQVLDLRTRQTLPDSAERVTSVQWVSDNRALFYTTEDPQTKRSDQMWHMKLGEKPELLYTENNELYSISLERTKDKNIWYWKARTPSV